MKTLQNVEAVVSDAYTDVVGVSPKDLDTTHCSETYECSELSGIVSEKLGVFEPMQPEDSLSEYALRVYERLQGSDEY